MAGPQDAAPPESVLLQQFAGLKNTVSPERLAQDDLEVAINIDIDDIKQPRRRRGYRKVIEGVWHSVYTTANGRTYGVKNQMLVRVNPDYSTVSLGMFCGDEALTWTEAGNSVYFCSMFISGRIASDDSIANWGAITSEGLWLSPIINPTATLNPVRGRLLGKPPMATAITTSQGRIYLAQGKTLWATELYMYDFVDKTRNFIQFEDEITCLGSVLDGFYVGTKSAIYYLDGPFSQMTRKQVAAYGAFAGSMIQTPPDGLPNPYKTSSHGAILVMTERGLCVGYDNGIFSQMTDDRVWFPPAEKVAAMVRRQDGFTSYVGVADSDGSPASNARIGDYVEAEIRRFQGVENV
jgi:hypothetical protein